jgi:hypothetical protein
VEGGFIIQDFMAAAHIFPLLMDRSSWIIFLEKMQRTRSTEPGIPTFVRKGIQQPPDQLCQMDHRQPHRTINF